MTEEKPREPPRPKDVDEATWRIYMQLIENAWKAAWRSVRKDKSK